MRHRRNADDRLRDLERRVAGGDTTQEEALLRERERAGVFDHAADVLIEQSMGRLPVPVIHKLHAELMRYDIFEKLPVYATLRPGAQVTGIFGTEVRALAGAANEGAGVATRHHFVQLAEQMDALIAVGEGSLTQGDTARARAAFAEALSLYNTSVPNQQIAVQKMLIE